MDPKEEIKSRVNIAELIGEYIQVKPAGSGSFKALCPFHMEKTPSFHISPDKQIWHCFGCGKGGDCFAFLMEMEGMDFPEALRHLGAKVGVEVQRFSSEKSNENQRLLAINDLAGKFFEKVLLDSPSAESVREYAARRGITPELRETFGIGFAPDSWDTLVSFLLKRGYNGPEIERAGLSLKRKSGDGWIDRFRNRLMIPLRNVHGDTVGFTGRIMPLPTNQPPQADGPKYMNSPETPMYRKGRLLFGLDLAKRAIKDAGNVIIVEGNLDVVASHKAGIKNVVASSGTALTQEQVDLIKRYTQTIVFSFDADAAGFSAAQRGIALARASGLDVRVAVLPPDAGKDPDEAVQKDPELWRAATGKTVPIMQYYIDRAITGRDLANVDDKRAVAKLVLPELGHVSDVVEREHWLQSVADLLRTDIDALRASISSSRPVAPSTQPPTSNPQPTTPQKLSKLDQAVVRLIGLYAQNPELRTEIHEALPLQLVPEGPLALLYKELRAQYDSDRSSPPTDTEISLFSRMRERLASRAETQSVVPLFDEAALQGEDLLATIPPNKVAQEVRQLIQLLTASQTERRKRLLEADIRRAESAGDHATVERLIREYNALP